MKPADELARLAEFNRNADRHWQSIAKDAAGRAHELNKPAGSLREAGFMFYRLGLLLTELRAGAGHTVLDFAAGSCWLSSLLNRMRCRTIAIDVSPAALALGRELFALDPRHLPELEPRFLAYDGHRLPVDDEAVDRIVCFDAFHHIPNQDEMLREFHRVLKTGGRVVFAEPGEGHSRTDQARFEVARFGILESDLNLADVLERGRAAGFERSAVKPYPDAEAVCFDFPDYQAFMAGEGGRYLLEALRQSLRHFSVFVLQKGEQRLDSRSPGVLRAEIVVGEVSVARGSSAPATASCSVRVRNTGDTHWLHSPDVAGGYVQLGAHVLDEGVQLVKADAARAALPRDVAPGDSVDALLQCPLPERPGRYQLRLDMVDEYVAWFEQLGSPTRDVPVSVFAADAL